MLLAILPTGTTSASAHADMAWVRRYKTPVNFNDVAHAIALGDSGHAYVTRYDYCGVPDCECACVY